MAERRFVAVLGATLLAAGVAGCSGSTQSSSPSSTQSSASGTEKARLTIDGQKQDLQEPASCSGHSGGFAIEIGKAPRDVFVRLTPVSPYEFGSIHIGDFTGSELEYPSAGGGGSAKLETSGTTYTITGEAVVQSTPPTNATKHFEFFVDCGG
jgi:lipoprotein LpqH